jgi:glycosyltransferase 2 family protein
MNSAYSSRRVLLATLYWLALIAFTAGLLYYSLRGIDWPQVGHILLTAKPLGVAALFGIGSVSLGLRAIRWRVLLLSEGDVSVSTAFWATATGYFGNSFLPARAGEVIRTFMISAGSSLSKSFVLATALSERVSDAVALIGISATILLSMPSRPGWLADTARPFAILGFCGVLGIALLPRLEGLGQRLLVRIPLPEALRNRLQGILQQAALGIRSFHDRGRLARFAGLTAVIWLNDAFATIVGARALGLTISLPVAFLLIAGLGLGSALPSTPGYVGIYQFVAVSVLVPFGFSRTDAIAYILFAQAFQYVVTALYGVVGLAQYRRLKVRSAIAAA